MCALAVCARRTTLKSEPFILLTGCIIINRDVTGWLCCFLLAAGLVRLPAYALSSRLSPHNGISCGQSVCDVRVLEGNVGRKVIDEGEGMSY